eukprot:981898-Prymnesium_polylepis.1
MEAVQSLPTEAAADEAATDMAYEVALDLSPDETVFPDAQPQSAATWSSTLFHLIVAEGIPAAEAWQAAKDAATVQDALQRVQDARQAAALGAQSVLDGSFQSATFQEILLNVD